MTYTPRDGTLLVNARRPGEDEVAFKVFYRDGIVAEGEAPEDLPDEITTLVDYLGPAGFEFEVSAGAVRMMVGEDYDGPNVPDDEILVVQRQEKSTSPIGRLASEAAQDRAARSPEYLAEQKRLRDLGNARDESK